MCHDIIFIELVTYENLTFKFRYFNVYLTKKGIEIDLNFPQWCERNKNASKHSRQVWNIIFLRCLHLTEYIKLFCNEQ